MLGFIIVFEWKIGKIAILSYLLNAILLFDEKNVGLIGIQVIFVALFLGVTMPDNQIADKKKNG